MSGGRTGNKGKFYYDADGAGGSAWLLAYGIKLIDTKSDWNTAEFKDRDSDLITKGLTFKMYEVSGTMNYKPDNPLALATFIAFRDAHEDGTDLGVFPSDKDITVSGNTCRGVQMDAKVVSFSRSEPPEEPMEIPFTLAVSCDSSFDHGWKDVTVS